MRRRFAICCGLFVASVLAVCTIANAAEVSRTAPGQRAPAISTTSSPRDSVQSRIATPVRGNIAPSETPGLSSRAAVSRESAAETPRQTARSARTEIGDNSASIATRRTGVAQRPTTANIGGRTATSGAANQTRAVAARAATIAGEALVSIEDSTAATESCLAQYTDCMDQFCSVIDANQKRCSCSNRLNSYARVESAVKEANSQLNDVAQNIRYIGLSADEIRAIMKETEAEQTLQTTRDNTQSRNMLEQIESLIRSPENFVSESSGNTIDFSDLTFDPNADPLDMFNLTGNTNSSFSNLRGTELYNAAKQRCQNLLNSCGSRGANVSQVQGRYDMEIDKDCINYEKGLVKMNDTLRSNVRSATQMLQKARLEVLNNQNQFDAKGCIGALETCMKDDMVCGGDYTKCLDPTKKYIDESGSVILGQNISTIRNMMNSYDNSLIDSNFVSSAWGMSGYPDCEGSNSNGKCIVKYLLSKIGMGESATSGLCRPVLDKCRRLTYDTRGKYDPKNSVVVGYVQRAMTNIRAAQENIISDYASSCMADIATCYSKQVTQINAWSSNANVQNVYSVLKGACRNVALTCSYAVFAADQSENGCPISSPQTQSNEGVCIENISDIFYQSMLCPDYSFWVPAQSGAMTGTMYPYSPETPTMVHVNERCVCQEGYGVNAGRCEICPTGSGFNQNCTAADGHTCLITGCSRCPGAEKYIYTPATQTYVCGTCPDGTAYINGQCI